MIMMMMIKYEGAACRCKTH